MKAANVAWVPVIPSGIPQRLRSVGGNAPYQPYLDGLADDVYLKAHEHKSDVYFTGQQMEDNTVFVDWTHKNSNKFWNTQLGYLHAAVPFSGVWLDLNEPSSVCTGVCYWDQKAQHPVQQKLTYIPSGRNLEEGTISLDVIDSKGNLQLDTHNLYGVQQAAVTDQFFRSTLRQRPFIMSRSSFAGLGKFAGRTLGNNYSKPSYMSYSVTGVMMQNIVGIPMAGADICGYEGDTSADLCARWYTVGAFYPFSRNHNSKAAVAQEPYADMFNALYGKTAFTYKQIISNSMHNKMSLVRYYYTEINMVQKTGGTFFKPLFFDYPNDAGAYNHQVRNVMLGESIKLGILADHGVVSQSNKIYFPKGTWCPIFIIGAVRCKTYTVGTEEAVSTDPWTFQLHLKAGRIVPF